MLGEDISICVCLAILISLFNEEGMHYTLFFSLKLEFYWLRSCHDVGNGIILVGDFDGGKSFEEKSITKMEIRRKLIFICKYAVNARPSRGNLKQVFGFLSSQSENLSD